MKPTRPLAVPLQFRIAGIARIAFIGCVACIACIAGVAGVAGIEGVAWIRCLSAAPLAPVAPASSAAEPVRRPAVAGRFYPEDPERLRLAVDAFLEDALPAPARRPIAPIAIVAPHAGYAFSGQICADAWMRARGHGVETVVILGTNHTAPPFRGAALLSGGAFRTPLGDVRIDSETVRRLRESDPRFVIDPGPHAREHSVEVQVPFLQRIFPGAALVPAVVGSSDPETCTALGKALASALAGRKALIVASTDLSHYPGHADAVCADQRTLEAMTTLDPARIRAVIREEEARRVPGLDTCACGEATVLVAAAAARALGATRGEVVSYANSGDTLLGDRDRVVGYGAVALYGEGPEPDGPQPEDPQPESPPSDALQAGRASGKDQATVGEESAIRARDREALLAFARRSIERFLRTETVPLPRGFDRRLRADRGAFVTLKKGGELRGCIGHMSEDTPLPQVVGAMALQAAFNDRRFPRLSPEELLRVQIEISVLTPARAVSGPEEIVVGRDGVVLSKGDRHAVFLPHVAVEQGWDRDEMLENLCRKAGLPRGSWKEGARFSTFQAVVFAEPETR